ncbi:hypothetical protein [Aeoliella mucimassa]|uniref:Uncharacterized protein n=1 Tax=Aeoliella mucimassa TaxID=2527972 RepID=A0A518AHL1_9BACT|nr:hypothetical protein [Aeoliella mucimassa]QDU54223.1 hypothetical protein Pan181_04030 [Aeoliella mucimassa]
MNVIFALIESSLFAAGGIVIGMLSSRVLDDRWQFDQHQGHWFWEPMQMVQLSLFGWNAGERASQVEAPLQGMTVLESRYVALSFFGGAWCCSLRSNMLERWNDPLANLLAVQE